MIPLLSRSPDAASPRMLLISASLHALFLFGIVILSFSMTKWPAPKDEVVSKVRLVNAESGPPVIEKAQQGPIKAPSALPREDVDAHMATPMERESTRQTLETAAVNLAHKDVIPLRKRKKPAEHVEPPKKPDTKKPDEATAKKKESPQTFLEKRLASIRKNVENRQTDAPPSSPGAADSQISGRNGSREGGAVAQEELLRWLEEVRNRINSRWLVFGDLRQVPRLTVIGVKIGDNGRLIDATVNESSGDEVFDKSALRAVFQADPFPAASTEVMGKIRKAGGLALRFTPKGMQ
jgi:colicin import membrane protein